MPKKRRHHLEHPRCGKYDGGHHAHSFLGAVTVPHRDGTRHGVWRMADRANHGDGSPSQACAALLPKQLAPPRSRSTRSPAFRCRRPMSLRGPSWVGATMKLSSVRWGIAGRILGLGAHDSGRRWCSDRHVVRALCTQYGATLRVARSTGTSNNDPPEAVVCTVLESPRATLHRRA